MSRVVVFSPSRYSLYTICVTELLRRRGVDVEAIFVRNIFNPARFLSEFRRDGVRLLKKVWRKLILREKAYRAAQYETISDFMKKEAIVLKRVDEFNKYGIPVISCDTLNDPLVVAGLKKSKPDLVVFTGGGLIRKDVLENSGAGVLNCHAGVLPPYRGMDVVEWPILDGRPDRVGMTVHFMDAGIDTGDILRVTQVQPAVGESFRQLRDRIEMLMSQAMVNACCDFLEGKLKRLPQRPEEGRQYFIMHPRLIRLAEEKLNHPGGQAR